MPPSEVGSQTYGRRRHGSSGDQQLRRSGSDDPAGHVVCVIAEVHNTYGQRHCYLLRPDYDGHAETEKAFYVSPFYPVDGYYRMNVPEPADRLTLTVSLHRPGDRPFSASVRGVAAPATTRAVLTTALRRPFESWLIRALITVHGLRLWRKGLPVQHRPEVPVDRSAARQLAHAVHAAVGIELPVRLRAWDGTEAACCGRPGNSASRAHT